MVEANHPLLRAIHSEGKELLGSLRVKADWTQQVREVSGDQ